ncbi:MAG: cbb3-type cytochrome c oxidase subunit II [Verrucomicrobiota bacterium]
MNRSGLLFPGLFATFAISLSVMVFAPYSQIGTLAPDFKEEDGAISDVYPNAVAGLPEVGKRVYVSQGCQACHTQIVRSNLSADIKRGWGARRTVARDYVLEKGAAFGSTRLGPDLSNLGSESWRNEPIGDLDKPAKRDAQWHYLHLYNPLAINKYSIMPAYSHLFEVRKVSGLGSPEALVLPKESAPEAGFEVVPSADAKALVAYLASLNRSHPLKEAGAVSVAQKK